MIFNYGVWLFSKCDHLTCPSHYAKKELIDMGVRATDRMTVISNGIDSGYYKPSGIPTKTILFVGRLMPEKCVDTLIRASRIVNKIYPEYTFVIGGSGYSMGDLKALAEKENPSIIFTDKLTEAKILELYQSCYMFVLPSEHELQGIALLEAMACGKPTIASDSSTSAANELANIIFTHGNHEELAEKIIYLIEHENEARELGIKNRLTIEQEHDYSTITEKFLDLYRSVIAAKNGERAFASR